MTRPVSAEAPPAVGRSARRARQPDVEGWAVRDAVRLAWASYGSGEATVVLLPTWSIVDSRIWKSQVGYLARHFRVITFDGRGCGRSDRPLSAASYTDDQFAADTVAVMDAASVEKAVLVGFSRGATWAVHVAATCPDRVTGLFAIAPACRFTDVSDIERDLWEAPQPTAKGWSKYNRPYWEGGGYPDFVEFFFGQVFGERHSTKQIEDCVGWGLENDPAVVVATADARLSCQGAVNPPVEPLCARVRCPVTVLHGTEDRLDPVAVGERLAELTGGTLIIAEGSGHGVLARDPVLVNTEIRRFAERIWPPAPTRTRWTRASRRAPRVLYLSSPIGLGHARRDVAIAAALRNVRPDVQIEWLAQHPVTRVLADQHETIHPASDWLASESGHIESEALDHDLHAFQAIRRMDEILINNFMVFDDVVAQQSYDLVVGDEAWDVDHFLHENPDRKRFCYAWLTDFVGWLPMPDGGAPEAVLTADYNAEMIEQRARFRRLRDRSIFVGRPDDVVARPFGPGLPDIREWTEANFDFAGYITGLEPVTADARGRFRAKHRYGDHESVCVVSVGGSGVGEALLRRVLDAVPLARRLAPALRFVVVCGPRIDPASMPCPSGAELVGYLPDLAEHLAACDVAVVQGGLSTCMELTAARRPFLYVPLRHHFEQNFHVRSRLANYRAGHCLDYEDACRPEILVDRLLATLDGDVDYRPVESDGARRAAAMLAELL